MLHEILLMWLINKRDSETIDVETAFLYALLEEEIYTKIPEGMVEVLEEGYKYEDILTLIKYIYSIVQAECRWFKEYIKTMNQKAGLEKCKTDPCLLYRVNELGTAIVIVYVDDILAKGEKSALKDTI